MKNFQHPFFDEVFYSKKVGSTSYKAENLITSNQAHGNFLYIAGEQTSARGRGKNSWFSPAGGLWFSVALYGFNFQSNITIFTGICLHRTICELFPSIAENLKIKWPNDIFLKNNKICGILSSHLESRKYHIIGIGLNTNVLELDKELAPRSTSLQSELDQLIDNQQLLSKFFDYFASALPEFVEGNLDIKYFDQNSLLKGFHIELDTDYDVFRGKAKGIDKNGALLIELKPGMIQPFYAGSVIDWTE